MNEKLHPPPIQLTTTPTMSTTATLLDQPLPLPPIDTEGASSNASTYHISVSQVPLEFGGTLKSSKSSKNNSNQQSPQKKTRNSSNKINKNGSNNSCSYCTCFGSCSSYGQQQQNRIIMPFWPAVLANLGICALLAGYIFIGSFIFLTIENSNEQVSSGTTTTTTTTTAVQHTAPQIFQQTTSANNLQKQNEANNSLNTVRRRNVRSSTRNKKNRRHLTKSATTSYLTGATAAAATVAAATTPEVSTHINGMHDDIVVVVGKRSSHSSIVSSDVASAVGATTTPLGDYDLQTLPLADIVVKHEIAAVSGSGASADDEHDYVGDDALAYNGDGADVTSLEDVERQRTVENIWDITVNLNILYKENWTRLAAMEIAKFQDQLVKRLVMDLTLSTTTTTNGAKQSTSAGNKIGDGVSAFGNIEGQHFWPTTTEQQNIQRRQQQQFSWYNQQRMRAQRSRLKNEHFEWNFATAFLYSMTVITTVGYGTITARTTLGRMFTIGYATLGIPLTLIYLSSIGSALAKILRYCCSVNAAAQRRRSRGGGGAGAGGLCCCCCLRRPTNAAINTNESRSNSNSSNTIFNRHPQVADRKTELKLKHFQQPQQQQPLPYCYVRPPATAAAATTAQEMEMQQQQQLGGGCSSSSSANIVTGGNTFDNLSIATSVTETTRRTRTSAAAATTTTAIFSWSIVGPAGFCVLFLIAYVTFGAVVIALLENWPLIDGVYFCFMSLSTIGFCDLLPGLHFVDVVDYTKRQRQQPTSASTSASAATSMNISVWFCAVYILSGLTLTSMCVNLLHDEIASRMRVVVKFEKVQHELQKDQCESGYYSGRS